MKFVFAAAKAQQKTRRRRQVNARLGVERL
jgi:hypothetical protein